MTGYWSKTSKTSCISHEFPSFSSRFVPFLLPLLNLRTMTNHHQAQGLGQVQHQPPSVSSFSVWLQAQAVSAEEWALSAEEWALSAEEWALSAEECDARLWAVVREEYDVRVWGWGLAQAVPNPW